MQNAEKATASLTGITNSVKLVKLRTRTQNIPITAIVKTLTKTLWCKLYIFVPQTLGKE